MRLRVVHIVWASNQFRETARLFPRHRLFCLKLCDWRGRPLPTDSSANSLFLMQRLNDFTTFRKTRKPQCAYAAFSTLNNFALICIKCTRTNTHATGQSDRWAISCADLRVFSNAATFWKLLSVVKIARQFFVKPKYPPNCSNMSYSPILPNLLYPSNLPIS